MIVTLKSAPFRSTPRTYFTMEDIALRGQKLVWRAERSFNYLFNYCKEIKTASGDSAVHCEPDWKPPVISWWNPCLKVRGEE